MKKLIHTLVIALLASFLFAQQKPSPIHFDADAPAWALLLLEETPNVREIQAAYKAWYDERPFVKNRYKP